MHTKNIYYAVVYPHILYGIEIYANTKLSYLDKLNKLNNKLLTILQNKPIITPLCELYKSYSTLSIPNLHKYQILLFVHKFIHHPELLPEVFIHSNFFYFTMKKFTVIIWELKIIYTFTTHLQHQSDKAAVLWNDLPSSLQQIESLLVFKNHLRCHLLSSI